MIDVYAGLGAIYPSALVRNGLTYPVAIAPFAPSARDFVIHDDSDPVMDPALLEAGLSHLKGIQRDRPGVHDGPVVRWLRTDADHVITTPGGYFDMLATSDAIRAEWVSTPGADLAGLPLRALAHAVPGGPLASGHGRCAAIGVTVIATHPGAEGERTFLIGRRSAALATDPGRWHIAPSGTLEPSIEGNPVPGTVAGELAEELGIQVSTEDVGGRIEVLGLAHDLLGLRPDLVVRLDLTAGEAAQLDPPTGGEFTDVARVAVEAGSLEQFWHDYPPEELTAPAAGAVALLVSTLSR